MLQQAVSRHGPTQADGDEPCCHHQQGERCDVDAEQIDFKELQPASPVSKKTRCWLRASRTKRIRPRSRAAREVCAPASATDARRPSSLSSWALAAALCPCAKATKA